MNILKDKVINLKLLQTRIIMRIKDYAEDQKFTSSVILNIFLFGTFFLFFTPRFESNDDISMMEIASGNFHGGPNEFLIFINIIIGNLMKYLYTVMPLYNWYVILLYMIQFIAMVIVFYIFLKHSSTAYNYLLYIAFFIIMLMPFIALLQFTTTAFLAGSSGMLLLITLSEGSNTKRSWVLLGVGILMVLLSGLLRINVFYLVLLLFAPLTIAMIIKTRNIIKIVPLVIAVALFFGAMIYNNLSYYNEDPEWQYYYQYSKLRAQLTDYPYYAWDENTSKIYEDVGWSENDVAMFRSWSFADQEKFSLEDLSYIVANITPFTRGFNDAYETFERAISNLGRTRLLFISACFLLAISFTRKNEKLVLIATVFIIMLAAFFFSYLGRLPFRIILLLTYTIGLVSLYYLSMRHNILLYKVKIIDSQKAFLFAFLAIYILTVIPFFAINARSSDSNRIDQVKMNAFFNELLSHDYIYAMWSLGLRARPVPAFYSEQSRDLKLFAVGGWIIPSPHHNYILNKYSIDNAYYALLKEDVLLISRPREIRFLEQYMNENYGLKVKIERASDFTEGRVYRVKEVD